MSERAEIEVLLPVDRVPTRAEHAELMATAWGSARQLVGQHGGRMLGLVSVARAETLLGQLGLKVRFAVLVPEAATERPIVVSVDRKVPAGRNTA